MGHYYGLDQESNGEQQKKGKLAAAQSILPETAIVGGKRYTTKDSNSAAQPKPLSNSTAPDTDELH